MPTFSKRSNENKATLDPRLAQVLDRAIQFYDFTIVCGFRNEEDQNKAFAEGNSKLRYPESKHNTKPSKAVDLIPYPSGYDDEREFYTMATYILASASQLGIGIRWGGHWTRFQDKPHFELVD